MISPEELKEIEARAEKATPRRWSQGGCSGRMIIAPGYGDIADVDTKYNSDFIAHSRSDIPALISSLREALETINVLRCLQRGQSMVVEDLGREIKDLGAENAELKRKLGVAEKALAGIKHMEKMTLLCDPSDYDFDPEKAYSAGANNAFCDVAGMARSALSEIQGAAPKEGGG